MNDFSVPDGFREVGQKEFIETPGDRFTGYFNEVARHFVREALVPPLPTEPYAVIRVTWDDKHGALEWPTKLALGMVHDWAWSGSKLDVDMEDLSKWITSFEVLSEPRAVTAKAVLDRFRTTLGLAGENPDHEMFALEDIAREFGVTS